MIWIASKFTKTFCSFFTAETIQKNLQLLLLALKLKDFFMLNDSLRGIFSQLHIQKQIPLLHKDYIDGYGSYTCEFLPLRHSDVVSYILIAELGRHFCLIYCKIFHKNMIISLGAKYISYKLLAHGLALVDKNLLLNWLDSPTSYKTKNSWSCSFSGSVRVLQAKSWM